MRKIRITKQTLQAPFTGPDSLRKSLDTVLSLKRQGINCNISQFRDTIVVSSYSKLFLKICKDELLTKKLIRLL